MRIGFLVGDVNVSGDPALRESREGLGTDSLRTENGTMLRCFFH